MKQAGGGKNNFVPSCLLLLWLLSEELEYDRSFPSEHLSINGNQGSSLVVQWLRVHLLMQGTWVQSLVGELRSHMHS